MLRTIFYYVTVIEPAFPVCTSRKQYRQKERSCCALPPEQVGVIFLMPDCKNREGCEFLHPGYEAAKANKVLE